VLFLHTLPEYLLKNTTKRILQREYQQKTAGAKGEWGGLVGEPQK